MLALALSAFWPILILDSWTAWGGAQDLLEALLILKEQLGSDSDSSDDEPPPRHTPQPVRQKMFDSDDDEDSDESDDDGTPRPPPPPRNSHGTVPRMKQHVFQSHVPPPHYAIRFCVIEQGLRPGPDAQTFRTTLDACPFGAAAGPFGSPTRTGTEADSPSGKPTEPAAAAKPYVAHSIQPRRRRAERELGYFL